ncbi:hypothetical protein [Lysobacter sp. Root494]|uniref:hypothetical protein n=1 Tax=Lysobacter sp. Root494 TaxID=1736549 RepID=UPI0006F4AF5E|nr:hypothetical protein [Lysobacter sp. Root494]KQY54981.1 hypothetical protein ASD14_02135 [Lysobacter sp. Root494]
MKLKTPCIVPALLLAVAGAVQAGPETTGALSVPANRVVGMWESSGTLTPCNGGPGPTIQVVATVVFQPGGTLVENPRTPTIARTIGLGTWSYDPPTSQHRQHLEFYRFNSDGSYAGRTLVDRDFIVSADGESTHGPVQASFYGVNDNLLFAVCGEVTAVRR